MNMKGFAVHVFQILNIDSGFMFKVKTSNYSTLIPV